MYLSFQFTSTLYSFLNILYMRVQDSIVLTAVRVWMLYIRTIFTHIFRRILFMLTKIRLVKRDSLLFKISINFCGFLLY